MNEHPTFQYIKERIAIEQEIGEYVMLTKRGKVYQGLCPFHNEKTPSFTVWPEKDGKPGTFKCMGACGAHGDVIGFVQQMPNKCETMTDAAKYLAVKYRIDVDFVSKSEAMQLDQSEQEIILANEFALKLFRQHFHSEKAREAQFYLLKRGFDKAMIQKWEIGYAPFDYAIQYDRDILLRADIITENGFPKFRDRIIFPIRDRLGRLVGFGGRKVNDRTSGPKYINTSETQAYQKRTLLYGLHRNQNYIKRKGFLFLVEGYTDVILIERMGIKGSIATCGTALSDEQALAIKKLAPIVVLLRDGDKAGLKAMVRDIGKLWQHRITVSPVILPQGQDPASLSISHGTAGLEIIEKNGKSAVEVLYDCAEGDEMEKTNKVLETLAICSNALMREQLLRELVGVSKFHYTTLIEQLNIHVRRLPKKMARGG